MAQLDSYALELSGVDKRFGEVHANKHIDLQVRKGSIHGIVGENGAGKSTLMSIIYGFYHADSGEMKVKDAPYKPGGSQDAIAAGIGMVHQHFMLVEPFTVMENMLLGAEGGRSRGDAEDGADEQAIAGGDGIGRGQSDGVAGLDVVFHDGDPRGKTKGGP